MNDRPSVIMRHYKSLSQKPCAVEEYIKPSSFECCSFASRSSFMVKVTSFNAVADVAVYMVKSLATAKPIF